VGEVKGNPQAGDLVDVYTAGGRWYARGFYNPHSKIRLRLLTFVEDESIDDVFWTRRIQRAVTLRRLLVSETNAYRLVHGEADLLPGLVVDRYADVLVMQTLSAGMDRLKEHVTDALTAATGVKSVYLRNDAKVRMQEGLPLESGFLREPGSTRRQIYEGPATFLVDIERGQKTGWFCDQRENRLAASVLAVGGAVLEVFCHTGAFGIHAALRGAVSVEGIDASQDALTLARTHAERNKVNAICTYREADASYKQKVWK
jgi:23S rRNA (cytosine1962-C5)-methyltransferase